MCGIAGSVDLAGRGRAQPWARDLLRHRGPDGSGVWVSADGNVAFEHTRLAIIDPENREADQPFADASGRWVMVYNGEVFNFGALRAELERLGVRFRTRSDTEVLLEGYVRWGKALLPRLRGMFAFAVCDRSTGEVFAARDQLGVKPLYYLEHDGRLAFSSEIKPLLELPGFTPRLSPAGVVEFLAFGKSPGRHTVVDGIVKLLPGHWLEVRDGRAETRQYWDLLPPPGSATISPTGDEVVQQLSDAVGAALVSDVPVGLMLSAGLDSSLVAAFAARQTDPRSLTAYSVAFGVPGDEAEDAGRLARDLGIGFREVRVDEGEVRDVFGDWLENLDYPSGNPTWIASWFIARAAGGDGVKVLLTGDGGDELFGGYTRWMKYLRFHDRVWSRIPRPVRRSAGAMAMGRLGGLAGDIARRAANDGDLFVASRPFHDDDLRLHLGPAGRRAADAAPPEQVFEDLRARFDSGDPGPDYLTWMSYAATKTSIVEDYLQRLDKMGMQHSVEGRVPLLDPVLARWVMAVPQDVKVVDGEQKSLLRAAGRRVLPGYVLDRRKQGFCAPVGDWVEGLLVGDSSPLSGPLVDEGLLNPDSLARLQASGSSGAFAAWTLAMLNDWCTRNLRAAAPA